MKSQWTGSFACVTHISFHYSWYRFRTCLFVYSIVGFTIVVITSFLTSNFIKVLLRNKDNKTLRTFDTFGHSFKNVTLVRSSSNQVWCTKFCNSLLISYTRQWLSLTNLSTPQLLERNTSVLCVIWNLNKKNSFFLFGKCFE